MAWGVHPGWEVWVRRRGCMLIRIIAGMGGIGNENGRGIIERGRESGIGWWWWLASVAGASGWMAGIG